MIEITVDDAYIINGECLKEGEPHKILDQGRLESALGNQYRGYLYGSDLQAAVSTFKSLVLNHPFANGNKRTAVQVLAIFADDLGEKILLDDKELSDLIYEIASEGGGNMSVNVLTNKLFGTDLDESLDLEEAAEKHDTLNPKLWDEAGNLKPEVREKILEIVKEFTDGLEEDEIKFNVEDIVLVGSNCSYNYTDKSDLDIHIRMDTDSLECPDDLYPLLYSAYRSLFNNKFDIDFYGIPVEIYVETSETEQMNDEQPLGEARKQSALKSNGIFSVLNNEWIKEPVKEDIPEVDKEAFDKLFAEWEERYFDIVHGEDLSQGITESIAEEASKQYRFYYVGPLFRFEHVFENSWEAYTTAISYRQAVSNFNAKAKEEFGFAPSAKLNINPKLVQLLKPEEHFELDMENAEVCDKCGRHLNDSGECPVCDLGDESALEESTESEYQDKITEIEDFIEDIYDLRKKSIAEEGEYGIGNLVFKEVRNLGYLDNLKELKNTLKSKHFSLESLEEHLTKEEIRHRINEVTEDKVRSWIGNKQGWGMTIDPDTLEKADFGAIPEGWVVTQSFGSNNIFEREDYAGITEFLKSLILQYGYKYYIGTYKIKYGRNRGKIDITVNKIIPDTVEAIKDAIKNKQESIYRFDEYLFLTHNLISRKDGKYRDYPLSMEDLEEYGLDEHIVKEPQKDCLNIELITGIYHTDIPATYNKK